MATEKKTETWKAKEFVQQDRGPVWTLFIIVVAAIVVIFALFRGDIILALLGALSGFSLIVLAHKRPRTATFTVSGQGIAVGRVLHEYEDFEHFSVLEQDEHHHDMSDADGDVSKSSKHSGEYPELYFRSKRFMKPSLHVSVPKGQLAAVKKIVKKHIELSNKPPTLMDMASRLLGS